MDQDTRARFFLPHVKAYVKDISVLFERKAMLQE